MPESNYIYGAHTAFQRYAEGTQTNVGLAVDGSLKTCVTLPSYYELAKAGRVYVGTTGTATAVACVTAIPTTAAAWALYNGNTALSGLCLSVLGIAYWQMSGTAGLGAQLIAGMSPTIQASALTTASNAFVKSASASTRTTAATFATGATLAGTPAWMAFGGQVTAASAYIGAGTFVRTDGLFLVQPGFALGLSVLGATGGSFGMSVVFAEVESYTV